MTVLTGALRLTVMLRKTAPLAAALVFMTLVLSCSDAPVVPAQSTNRRVFAEMVGESG